MPMKIVRLLPAVALVFLLCAAPLRLSAASEGGKPRIVALLSARSPVYEEVLRSFREILAGGGHPARVDTVIVSNDQAATKRVLKQADLVFALGSRATREAIGAGVDLPVIAGMIVRKDDLRGGGSNVTGVFLQHPLDVQFRHIRTIIPKAKRIAVMYTPEENGPLIEKAAVSAAAAGLQLVPYEVRSPSDTPGALDRISRSADVLWGIPDKSMLKAVTAEKVILFSLRNRIPLVGLSPTWAKAGALYALGWDYHDIGIQCGNMAVAALAGRRPGDISPEAPRKAPLIVNRKTAERLKLPLPDEILKNALEIN